MYFIEIFNKLHFLKKVEAVKKVRKFYFTKNLVSAFRCAYCLQWNPARKQRPHAPNLTSDNASHDESDANNSEFGMKIVFLNFASSSSFNVPCT